jgi:ubiquinone biosynthesis protein
MTSRLQFASLPRDTGDRIAPQRARSRLEQLGPTFVKFGQFLALCPDLIAQEYCDEFLCLTDQVTPLSFTDVARILEEDLGEPVSECFTSIASQPVIAASLAQVHVACTQNGATVAVKVQREGIHKAVQRDLRRARIIGSILKVIGSSIVSPAEVVDEFSHSMYEELDLQHELRNLVLMHQLAHDYPNIQVPRPCSELSGKRVLTTEYLSGMPFTKLLPLVRANQPDRIEALGFDRRALAVNLLDAVLTQIFRLEFFHADMHPSNILAMPDNRIGFVDFGPAGELNSTVRQGMIRYLASVHAKDVEGIFESLAELLLPTHESDPHQFRSDFYEQSRRWIREREALLPAAALHDSQTAQYLVGVLRAARQNRYRVPAPIPSIYRALLNAEILARQLCGDVNLSEVYSRFFERLQAYSATLQPRNLELSLLEAMELARDGPRQARRVLADIADGRFVLSARIVSSDEDRRRASDCARLIAAAALSIGLSLLIAGTRDAMLPGGTRLAGVLWAALILDWIVVLVLWRRLS